MLGLANRFVDTADCKSRPLKNLNIKSNILHNFSNINLTAFATNLKINIKLESTTKEFHKTQNFKRIFYAKKMQIWNLNSVHLLTSDCHFVAFYVHRPSLHWMVKHILLRSTFCKSILSPPVCQPHEIVWVNVIKPHRLSILTFILF